MSSARCTGSPRSVHDSAAPTGTRRSPIERRVIASQLQLTVQLTGTPENRSRRLIVITADNREELITESRVDSVTHSTVLSNHR